MPARALAEDRLRRFLLRRRRGSGPVEPPAMGRLLAETLDLAARLVSASSGFIALNDPAEPERESLTLVAAFGQECERRVGERLSEVTEEEAGERPDGEGDLVEQALLSGGTVVQPEVGRTPARIAVAVRLEHAVSGVLVLSAQRTRLLGVRDVEIVELLARYVSRAILNAVDVLKQNDLARRDELTGVRNVRALQDELSEAVKRAVRTRGDVAVLFVDVDRLKHVNDRLGHAAGSEMLKRVGHALARTVDTSGEVYRLGGDEFVVVAPELDIRAARALGTKMRSAVREATPGPLRHIGVLPAVTISVGVATLRASLRPRGDERRRASRLLVAADRALYRAKNAGRDAVSVATVRDDTPRRRTAG